MTPPRRRGIHHSLLAGLAFEQDQLERARRVGRGDRVSTTDTTHRSWWRSCFTHQLGRILSTSTAQAVTWWSITAAAVAVIAGVTATRARYVTAISTLLHGVGHALLAILGSQEKSSTSRPRRPPASSMRWALAASSACSTSATRMVSVPSSAWRRRRSSASVSVMPSGAITGRT